MGARVAVVGLSGPDGAGKSTLRRELTRALAHEQVPVTATYLYGCVLCRRSSAQDWVPSALAAAGTAAVPGPRRGPAELLRRGHAVLDAVELRLRLAVAVRRAGRRGGVVLTDRTPLDGLVKHALPSSAVAARLLRRTAGRYRAVYLLDAPAGTLADRDREHSAPHLERLREGYRGQAAALRSVHLVPTDAEPSRSIARRLAGDLVGR